MSHRPLIALGALGMVAAAGTLAHAHCQVPCGIYNDPVRFTLMEEHVATIEKSMEQIEELSQEAKPNYNQIVRWVANKEHHADELSEIVTYYFLAQRVKPADPEDKAAMAKYLEQLTLLHQMVVTAMKCKQTTDLENCAKLREQIKAFRGLYLGEEAGHAHAPGEAPHKH